MPRRFSHTAWDTRLFLHAALLDEYVKEYDELFNMTKSDIAALPMKSQRISAARCECLEEVVQWMGAMLAQDYVQTLWAVGRARGMPDGAGLIR